MKKALKSLSCFILMACLFCAAVPVRTEARWLKQSEYTYKTINLKQNVFVSAKGDTMTSAFIEKTRHWVFKHKCHLYKITVPSGGYVKIQTKNQGEDDINIYNKIDKKQGLDYNDPVCILKKKSAYRCVMPAGNYYIYAEKGTKLKWSFVKAASPANYCRAKAEKLASGKKEKVVFNYGYEFDRWYKIVLSKKQPITISVNDLSEGGGVNISVTKSNGVCIKSGGLHSTGFRTGTLPKGTYYIRVAPDGYEYRDNNCLGQMCTLSWK